MKNKKHLFEQRTAVPRLVFREQPKLYPGENKERHDLERQKLQSISQANEGLLARLTGIGAFQYANEGDENYQDHICPYNTCLLQDIYGSSLS